MKLKVWSMENIKDKERDRIYGRGEVKERLPEKESRFCVRLTNGCIVGTDYYAPVKAYICFGLCHKRNAPEDFAKNLGA